MKKEEWLRGEIAKWRSDGAVDTATADALLARYPVNGSRIGWGAIVAGAFGALLIGLGIIAIFAANWDCLDRGMRAVVSVAPVAVCGIVALVAKSKGWKSMALWEPIGILWFISVVAASCLVAQTYQVGGSVPGLVLFVAALTLPVVWTTHSVGAMTAWPVLPIVWAFSSMEWRWHAKEAAIAAEALLMMAASLPAYVAFIRRNPPRASLVIGQIGSALAYSFGAGLVVCRCVHMSDGCVLVFWLCAAAVFGAAKIWKLPVWTEVAVVVATCAGIATPFLEFGLYALALVLAIAVAGWGITRMRIFLSNMGLALLLWLILAKFFESRVDFTIKGLVLIASGVLLAVLNVFLVRAKKRRAE